MQTEVLRSGDTGCNLPVNLKRLIENAQRKFGCRPHKRGFTGGSQGPPRPGYGAWACQWRAGPLGGGRRGPGHTRARRQGASALCSSAHKQRAALLRGGWRAPSISTLPDAPSAPPQQALLPVVSVPRRPGPAGGGAARAGAVPEAHGGVGGVGTLSNIDCYCGMLRIASYCSASSCLCSCKLVEGPASVGS